MRGAPHRFYIVEDEDGDCEIWGHDDRGEYGPICICGKPGADWLVCAMNLARSVEVSGGISILALNFGGVEIVKNQVH